MAQYIIPAAGLIIVAIIEALAARERKEVKKSREDEEKRQEDQEKLLVLLIRSTGAAIALGEATAKAVQKIPDAHCNGDMHVALEYATSIKHEQKEFLEKQGVRGVWE